MITAVAKMKYGQNLADFLVAHLPKKDGSGTVDYDIQDADVNALNNEDCIDELNGYGEGAVGKVFQHGESANMYRVDAKGLTQEME